MHMSRERARATREAGRSIFGVSLPWMIASMALAKTAPFHGGQFQVASGPMPAATAGCFENVAMRTLTFGERVIRLDDGRQRAPIHVRITQLDDAGNESAPIDSGARAPLALTRDVERPRGMSALDALSSNDLGRMIRGDAHQATRVQVFLAMQERDDDAFADDAMPELVLFGTGDGTSLRVTPILDGSPDVPASLAFGATREVSAETFARSPLPVRIGFDGDDQARTVGAVGLDLSGDLGVGPGKSVVGYQIDIPAGCTAPMKMLASGEVEFGAYANFADVAPELAKAALGQFGSEGSSLDAAEDAVTAIMGPVYMGTGNGDTTEGPVNIAGMTQPEGPTFAPSANLPFAETGSWPTNPPPPPADAPVIPGPSVLSLLGAGGLIAHRGRRRD
jgi:hypothetical protein